MGNHLEKKKVKNQNNSVLQDPYSQVKIMYSKISGEKSLSGDVHIRGCIRK